MLTDNPAAPLILVVEDDPSHAELIKRSLEDAVEEYRLEIVETITAAKIAVERFSPSIVLTDYRLPDGDGSELVAMAAGFLPVIIMTSHGSEKFAVEAMKIGAQDYIVKSPETFASLSRTIKYALMAWALVLVRRQASDAALRAKKDWERTFDAVPDMISIVDLNNTILRVNRAMADRCGLTPQEIVGRKCHEVVHGLENPPPNCPHARLVRDGLVHNEEVHEKVFDAVFDVTVSPLNDDDGLMSAVVHVMRDITGRKLAEKNLQNFERQFQQTQKLESLGVLAGGIAHDFNNILTIIIGHCFIIREDVDSGMSYKSHVEQIENSANRAADLCRQMLTYAGKEHLVQTQVNLWLLVDETVKMLKSALKKNVTIETDLKRDVPEIVGDNSQIRQVIMNLILNAGESIEDNNGTVKISLEKTTVPAGQVEVDFFGNSIPPGSYASVKVVDNGCGMVEEVQKRIFEPFFTTKFTGRGLGMSTVLGIIRAHSGALQLFSEKGVGTTFNVYLPLLTVADAAETTSGIETAATGKKKYTIMLVDDEVALLTVGAALLEAMGFSVVTASNGSDAVEIYRQQQSGIDLVIMDLVMPGMGGVEAYRELRKIDSVVPVMICSGYGAESVEDVITGDQRASFLHKPYNPAELRMELNRMVG
ncbi:MAG: response regulator [Desulfuromonadaceae bacterium]|nr:response regulator [Desulfuromonadaceae bacterium]MDD2847830.1 response regulator [Desulfuromonadaceae bacterium]MDD4129625.1 response regulator [Desulfuromonadaceae bacterium]